MTRPDQTVCDINVSAPVNTSHVVGVPIHKVCGGMIVRGSDDRMHGSCQTCGAIGYIVPVRASRVTDLSGEKDAAHRTSVADAAGLSGLHGATPPTEADGFEPTDDDLASS